MPENETDWLNELPKSWHNQIFILLKKRYWFIEKGWLGHDEKQIHAHALEKTADSGTARIAQTLEIKINEIVLILITDLKTGTKTIFTRVSA